MDAIERMVAEHDNILLFIEVLDAMSLSIMAEASVTAEDIASAIHFARSYADAYHHGKEEQILFNRMLESDNPAAQTMIKHGMLVEHDMGRYYMGQLEATLAKYQADAHAPSVRKDLIVYMGAWSDLLRRHIAKENQVCYPFAKRTLNSEVLEHVDEEVLHFEDTHSAEPLLAELERLHARYLA